MRILDVNGNEVQNPDLDLGYLTNDRIFIAHHEAIEAVKEVYHYETEREYPNGGRDVKKVIDVPAVEAKEAWDEYEDIKRYKLYTEEELQKNATAKAKIYSSITINGNSKMFGEIASSLLHRAPES